MAEAALIPYPALVFSAVGLSVLLTLVFIVLSVVSVRREEARKEK